MARKRLSPLGGSWDEDAGDPARAGAPLSAPPIARVAGEAATAAAFEEMASTLEAARRDGRMAIELALDLVETDHQSRDRVTAEAGPMEELKASIATRGQQSPIEVEALAGGRYGLIAGWRRLRALQELLGETGDPRFATVLAVQRRPADRAAAYVAMVEENEIRADLSFYERAHIVAQSLKDGVFETEKQALGALFASASYPRRSKIKSFLPVVTELGGTLRFPTAIPERLGLMLARALEAPGRGAELRALLAATPPATAEDEAALLLAQLGPEPAAAGGPGAVEAAIPAPSQGAAPVRPAPAAAPAGSEPVSDPGPGTVSGSAAGRGPAADWVPGQDAEEPMSDPYLIAPGIRFSARRGRIELEGSGVQAGLIARLQDWLRSQS